MLQIVWNLRKKNQGFVTIHFILWRYLFIGSIQIRILEVIWKFSDLKISVKPLCENHILNRQSGLCKQAFTWYLVSLMQIWLISQICVTGQLYQESAEPLFVISAKCSFIQRLSCIMICYFMLVSNVFLLITSSSSSIGHEFSFSLCSS